MKQGKKLKSESGKSQKYEIQEDTPHTDPWYKSLSKNSTEKNTSNSRLVSVNSIIMRM